MERASHPYRYWISAACSLFLTIGLLTPQITAAAQLSMGKRLALTLRANTVAVRAEFGDGTTETGFGIIVAKNQGALWIATPNHIARGFSGTNVPTRIGLRFYGSSAPQQSAQLLPQQNQKRDIAVLRTAIPKSLIWYPQCIGTLDDITHGDKVWFVGQAGHWYVPSQPGNINKVDPTFGIIVDGLTTQVGSSGAPLISTRGILGLVASSDSLGSTQNAIPLNVVADQFASWGLPWSLKPLSLTRTRPVSLPGVDDLIALGDRLREAADLKAAADHYTQALKIDKNDPLTLLRAYETQRQLALFDTNYPTKLAMDDERSAKAVRLIYRLLKLDESIRDAELQIQISTLTRLAKGNWSIDYLISYLTPYLDDARIRAEIGLLKSIYRSREDPGAGLDLLQNAHTKLPDDPLVQRFLAYCLRKYGDLQGSAHAYVKTVRLSGDKTTVAVLNRKASLQSFLEILVKLERTVPGSAVTWSDEVPIAESMQLLKQAQAENPEWAEDEVHFILAQMQVKLGHLDTAEQEILKALNWSPTQPLGYRIQYLKSKRSRRMVKLATELLRNSGSHPALLFAFERHVLGIEPEQSTTDTPGGWMLPPLQIGHRGWINAMAVSVDGRRIVTGDKYSVRIWNTINGRVERVLPISSRPCGVRFSRDGTQVVVLSAGKGHIWDLKSGRLLQFYKGPLQTSVNSCTIEFDNAGSILGIQGKTGDLVSWNMDSSTRTLAAFEGHTLGLASSPDGNIVATSHNSGDSHVLELRDTHSGDLRNSFSLRERSRYLIFDPSGKRIGVVGHDNVIEILDIETGKRLQKIHTEIYRSIKSIAFSPDGTMLAIEMSGRQPTEIWDVTEGRRKRKLDDSHESVAWMPDSRRLVTADRDGAQIWDINTGEKTQSFPPKAHGKGENAIAISPGGRLLLVGTESRNGSKWVKSASIWELDNRRLRCSVKRSGMYGLVVFKLATFSPDNRWFAIGLDSSHHVEIWDTQCEKKIGTVEINMPWGTVEYDPQALAFSPDSRSIAYIPENNKKSIVLRDLISFEIITVLEGHEDEIVDIEFNARDGRLASAGEDGTIRIWNPTAGRQLHRIDAHENVVKSVTWSPEGKLLGSTGAGSEAAIWDTNSGALRVRFHAFFDSDNGHVLRFAPDGESLVAISIRAGTLTRWNVADGRFLGELPLNAGKVSFRSVLPPPDERTLALAIGETKDGGPLLLVDLVTGNSRRMFRGMPDGGWVTVTPTGKINGPDPVLKRYVARGN